MSPLLVGADNNFSNCIFLPRASKPVNVNFEYSGRRLSARIYSSVAYHVLPKNVSGKYLVVSINNAGDIKFSNNFPPITNSCGQGVFIFNQPSEEVTAQKFLNMIVQQSNTSENIQIAISRSPSRTIFSVRPENNKVVISQTVINNFRNSGVMINQSEKINVISCSGDCSKGFTVAVPLGSTKDAKRKIFSAGFPMLPNQRIDVGGTGKCKWNKTNDNTITFDYCTTGNDGNNTDNQPD